MRVSERVSWNVQASALRLDRTPLALLGCATCSALSEAQAELRTVLAARLADRIGRGVRVVRAFVQGAW